MLRTNKAQLVNRKLPSNFRCTWHHASNFKNWVPFRSQVLPFATWYQDQPETGTSKFTSISALSVSVYIATIAKNTQSSTLYTTALNEIRHIHWWRRQLEWRSITQQIDETLPHRTNNTINTLRQTHNRIAARNESTPQTHPLSQDERELLRRMNNTTTQPSRIRAWVREGGSAAARLEL